MSAILLIPTALCILAFFRGPVHKAFRDVFLPIFLFFPTFYFWKVAALPPMDVSEAVLLPLGVAMLLKEMPRWRLSLMDLALAVFLFTSFHADALAGHSVASIFDLVAALLCALVPYMAGKLLIEQPGARIATAKRIVFLVFLSSLVSTYEWRMERNPFLFFWSRFFPDEEFHWVTQIRWGHGRVAGPYGQSELAGMMLFFALVLALFLKDDWERKFRYAPWLPFRKSSLITCAIAVVLLMTQARGPWIGALIAVPVALLGRSKRVLRSSLLMLAALLVVAPLGYLGMKHYVSSPATGSDEQHTAQYRSQLLDEYIPIAEHGGPWGGGQDFPRVMGLGSIDNEYLFVALTQGWAGLAAFCLLASGAVFHLLSAALLSRDARDRSFSFALLGIFTGLLVTIFTVYLGNQPYELFFLLAGWSQAIRPQSAPALAKQPQPQAFQQVYT